MSAQKGRTIYEAKLVTESHRHTHSHREAITSRHSIRRGRVAHTDAAGPPGCRAAAPNADLTHCSHRTLDTEGPGTTGVHSKLPAAEPGTADPERIRVITLYKEIPGGNLKNIVRNTLATVFSRKSCGHISWQTRTRRPDHGHTASQEIHPAFVCVAVGAETLC